MADTRRAYRSAFRGARAPVSSTRVPSVSSPVGPDSTTVGMRGTTPSFSNFPGTPPQPLAPQQAQALRAPADYWDAVPKEMQAALSAGYQSGGFEGVQKAIPNWYDLPEYIRTNLLDRSREGGA